MIVFANHKYKLKILRTKQFNYFLKKFWWKLVDNEESLNEKIFD